MKTSRQEKIPYYLLSPTLIVILFVVIFPLSWAIFISLHRWNPTVSPQRTFVGVGNFIHVFTDSRFIASLGRMLYYSGLGTVIETTLATAVALALVKYIKSNVIRTVLLTLYLLPMMVANIIAGEIWVLLVTATGTLNNILISIGLSPIAWRSPQLALTTAMVTDIWQWTGLPLLIIYAGRISIPQNLYEAAYLDGASDWMIFKRITLPYLTIPIGMAFLFRFMDSCKYFDKIFVLTYGGPGNATEVPSFYLYLQGFSYYNVGYAAALNLVYGFAIVFALMALWKLIRRKSMGG